MRRNRTIVLVIYISLYIYIYQGLFRDDEIVQHGWLWTTQQHTTPHRRTQIGHSHVFLLQVSRWLLPQEICDRRCCNVESPFRLLDIWHHENDPFQRVPVRDPRNGKIVPCYEDKNYMTTTTKWYIYIYILSLELFEIMLYSGGAWISLHFHCYYITIRLRACVCATDSSRAKDKGSTVSTDYIFMAYLLIIRSE